MCYIFTDNPHVLFYISSDNPLIRGDANCNLPILIQIISEALHHEVLDKDEEVKQRVLQIARTALVSHLIIYDMPFIYCIQTLTRHS